MHELNTYLTATELNSLQFFIRTNKAAALIPDIPYPWQYLYYTQFFLLLGFNPTKNHFGLISFSLADGQIWEAENGTGLTVGWLCSCICSWTVKHVQGSSCLHDTDYLCHESNVSFLSFQIIHQSEAHPKAGKQIICSFTTIPFLRQNPQIFIIWKSLFLWWQKHIQKHCHGNSKHPLC